MEQQWLGIRCRPPAGLLAWRPSVMETLHAVMLTLTSERFIIVYLIPRCIITPLCNGDCGNPMFCLSRVIFKVIANIIPRSYVMEIILVPALVWIKSSVTIRTGESNVTSNNPFMQEQWCVWQCGRLMV